MKRAPCQLYGIEGGSIMLCGFVAARGTGSTAQVEASMESTKHNTFL